MKGRLLSVPISVDDFTWMHMAGHRFSISKKHKSLCVYIVINMYTCCHSHRMGVLHHVFSRRTSYHRSCDLIFSPWERDEVYLSPLFSASVNQHYWYIHTHTLLQLIKHWSGLQYRITSVEAPEVHLVFNQVLIRVLI